MIKKHLFTLLLFIYFLAAYLGAVHIHHDSEEGYHDDCQVCILSSNLHSGDIPSLESIFSQLDVLFLAPYFTTAHYTFNPILSYQAQAPPYFFFT
jgi:hypothetical protein